MRGHARDIVENSVFVGLLQCLYMKFSGLNIMRVKQLFKTLLFNLKLHLNFFPAKFH